MEDLHEPLIRVSCEAFVARTEIAHLIRRERYKLDQYHDIVSRGNPPVCEEQECRSGPLSGPETRNLPIKRDKGVVYQEN